MSDTADNLLVLVPGNMSGQWVVVDPGWNFAAELDMVVVPASEMAPDIADQNLILESGMLDLYAKMAFASA